MGTFTITVTAKVAPVINITSSTISNCGDVYEVLIDVPSGTRHVTITSSGSGASPSLTATITGDTTYFIFLDGNRNPTTPTLNTVSQSVRIDVRDTSASGEVLETRVWTRKHTGDFC